MYTPDHWKQLAQGLDYILRNTMATLLELNKISRTLLAGTIPGLIMANRLRVVPNDLQFLYSAIAVLTRSSLFHNFLMVLKPVLLATFPDKVASPRACPSYSPRYTHDLQLYYLDWLKNQRYHMDAYVELERYYTDFVCCILDKHTLPVTTPLTITFQFLHTTQIPAVPDPESVQKTRQVLIDDHKSHFNTPTVYRTDIKKPLKILMCNPSLDRLPRLARVPYIALYI